MFIPFLLTSCAEEKLTGRTGESVSFSADIAEDSNDLDYIWTLVEQPDASLVNVIHFHFNEVRSTASFIPDKPGSYEMEVKVFQYGDELALQTFQIQVEQGENVPLPPPPTTEPDWYEKESDRQWFEEPVEEINEIPEITEVAPAIDNIVEVVKEAEIEKPSPPATPKPKPIPRGINIPKNEGRFTIQVVSKKSLNDAEVIAAKLIDSGFDAYIQKAYFKETDEVWFRVRVGSYNSRPAALAVAKNISETRGTSTWVDYVRYEE
ncbi:MAG: SPOR domain-containing protein [Candidatus Marinimicrobia bacterium]|nr:SPOR domain-containing protein [Candidatus Neomarinimicrobiota bacterium]MDP7217215.1 SPOR domain-containing protein [Candidatus Neomarinimicrobiota bacterium]